MTDYTYAEYWNMSPSDLNPNDTITVKVVAVMGYGAHFAAYAGVDEQSTEEIATGGDKIRKEAADGLFNALTQVFTFRP